jgi:hypothetical protein
MLRSTRHLAPLALVALIGCQDYNFSPVKYCLIQPGTERVQLSDISTADILFVVDDSGSMGGEQQKLADSFDAFVTKLVDTNQTRVASSLDPIDFHIAVTTTSLFFNTPVNGACSSTCAGAVGQSVCCDQSTSQPISIPKACAGDGDCKAGDTCRTDCQGSALEKTCCAAANAEPERVPEACTTVGAPCGLILRRYNETHTPRLCTGTTTCATQDPTAIPALLAAPAGYACRTTCVGLSGLSACCDASGNPWRDATCDIGVGTDRGLYPRGDFVRAGTNERVLHFEKGLFCTLVADPLPGDPGHQKCADSTSNPTAIADLVTKFKSNVRVGTCGSGQEQGLEASRRAIQKAFKLDGLSQPLEDSGPDAGKTPVWPHAKSKLVVAYVGDEDDCSAPEDPNTGIIMTLPPVADACVLDGGLPADQQRRYPISRYADFLASLGRPAAGAFIVSAVANDCVDDACQAGLCTDPLCTEAPAVCGGQAAGFRFLDFRATLAGKGDDTVAGSICNPGAAGAPGFSSILSRIAEVVKQPVGLQLPTLPASGNLIILRITSGGATRKTCNGPAPTGLTQADAEAANYDWWFTGGDDRDRTPTGPSKFIYINRKDNLRCVANPGETYSADYLGLVPAGGCDPDPVLGPISCATALGGTPDDWTCDVSPGAARGTCLCGSGL